MRDIDRLDVLSEPQRIQKLLAERGFGSRRQIEMLIACGQVMVNGCTASLGDKATTYDTILIRRKQAVLPREIASCALLCHKPCGVLVTRKDRQKRPTVFSMLPQPPQGRWVAVGRLDYNTSGLLVICNDGQLASRMMHPSYRLEREYSLCVHGRVTERILQNLRKGVSLDGRNARFDRVEAVGKPGNTNRWFRVLLHEGRNREVRRLWQSQGMTVNCLERVRFCFLRLDIPRGSWRCLTRHELSRLYRRVNLPLPLLYTPDKT